MNPWNWTRWAVLLSALLIGPASSAPPEGGARPPLAKKVPKSITIHGESFTDPYFWLREKTNPEVNDYLEAENAYTAAVMKPTEAMQQALYREMLGRIDETDRSAPYRLNGAWYYTRTEQGKQYPIHGRKRGSLEATEEILLD